MLDVYYYGFDVITETIAMYFDVGIGRTTEVPACQVALQAKLVCICV